MSIVACPECGEEFDVDPGDLEDGGGFALVECPDCGEEVTVAGESESTPTTYAGELAALVALVEASTDPAVAGAVAIAVEKLVAVLDLVYAKEPILRIGVPIQLYSVLLHSGDRQ